MSEFFNSVKEVNKNYAKYDKWEQEQADKKEQKAYLAKTLEIKPDVLEKTTSKAKAIIRATEIMDKRSEDNAEDSEQATGLMLMSAILGLQIFTLPMMKKAMLDPKKMKKFQVFQLVSGLAVTLGSIFWGAQRQKDASRVGRFQAKNNELKDARNFVAYTPEQIEAAKIIAKNMPDKNDKKGIIKVFKEMKQYSKDRKAYKKWLEEKIKNPEDRQKLLNATFNDAQIKQGKEDKDLITHIVKDINIKAEEYSENAETSFQTLGMLSFLGAVPLGFGINAVLKKFKNAPSPIIRKIVSASSAAIVSIGILIWGTAQQKKASRVGRFQARQELLEDPKKLVYYNEEQMSQAKDIKASVKKKGFWKRIGDNVKFLGSYLNDKKEYEKYFKNEGAENKKIYKALNQVELQKGQLEEAKHLQEKAFNTFDKIDEMSQRYTEDVEAGIEAAQVGVSYTASFLPLLVGAGILALAKKGKLPIAKIINKVANISMKEESNARKLVNEAYEVIRKDKSLKEAVNKALFADENAKNLIKQNKELASLWLKLKEKFLKNERKLYGVDSAKELKNIANKHFKQGPISRWIRNLTTDISKLWVNDKIQIPEEIIGSFKLNYSNYKTMWNTLGVALAPGLAVMFGLPFAFNSWVTNIQKKAGKIGIMQAVEEMNDPKLYVNPDINKENIANNLDKEKPENNFAGTKSDINQSYLSKWKNQFKKKAV